jgi:CheY-like chemotaxis protein
VLDTAGDHLPGLLYQGSAMPTSPPDAYTLSLLNRQESLVGVLVVEDDEPIREAIVLLLEGEGYVVLQAANGAEALDVLRSVDQPLVVLLDWMMPKLNGMELLETVLREPAGLDRHAYILMSAALPSWQKLARLPVGVCTSVLSKPFDITAVLDAVAQAAAGISQRQDAQWSTTRETFG